MTATPTCQAEAERFSTRLRTVSARSAPLVLRRERPGESAAGASAGRASKKTRWAGILRGIFSPKMRTPELQNGENVRTSRRPVKDSPAGNWRNLPGDYRNRPGRPGARTSRSGRASGRIAGDG